MATGYIKDERLSIARGLIRGASSIHKFGAVPAMSINTTGTVWDVNDTIYPWSSFSSASTLTVQAVNASDNAKKLTIEGLDGNYDPLSEEVTLSSSGTVTTSNSFIRVFRGFISEGAANVGAIDVRISSTTVLKSNVGQSQTLMSVYTIPAGKIGYLLKGVCTAQNGADATGSMFVRYFGETAFRIGHSFEVTGAGGKYEYEFGVPFAIPEKSDIDVRVSTRSNNGRYTAGFDIILLDNPRTMDVS